MSKNKILSVNKKKRVSNISRKKIKEGGMFYLGDGPNATLVNIQDNTVATGKYIEKLQEQLKQQQLQIQLSGQQVYNIQMGQDGYLGYKQDLIQEQAL